MPSQYFSVGIQSYLWRGSNCCILHGAGVLQTQGEEISPLLFLLLSMVLKVLSFMQIVCPVSGLPTMAASTDNSRLRIARGMESLVSLANKLISPQNTPGFHEEMQENAKHACEEMTAAKEQLENELRTVDSQTVEQADNLPLNNQLNETKLNLSQLNIQLKYHEETNKYAQEMVMTAKKHLTKLEKLEEKVRQEEKWYTIARNIALVFMPLSTLMGRYRPKPLHHMGCGRSSELSRVPASCVINSVTAVTRW